MNTYLEYIELTLQPDQQAVYKELLGDIDTFHKMRAMPRASGKTTVLCHLVHYLLKTYQDSEIVFSLPTYEIMRRMSKTTPSNVRCCTHDEITKGVTLHGSYSKRDTTYFVVVDEIAHQRTEIPDFVTSIKNCIRAKEIFSLTSAM